MSAWCWSQWKLVEHIYRGVASARGKQAKPGLETEQHGSFGRHACVAEPISSAHDLGRRRMEAKACGRTG